MNPSKHVFSLPRPESGFGVEDLYKLLHQAFHGPGHAIPSRASADAYLREEWTTPGGSMDEEPLIEALLAGAPFVRVHLRPYRDRGGTAAALLEAFLRSAAIPTDPRAFVTAWLDAGRMIEAGRIPLDADAYRTLDAQAAAAGYPAIHHSAAYLERARPAYRVLARSEAEQLERELPDLP
jgi:hypothetical protein